MSVQLIRCFVLAAVVPVAAYAAEPWTGTCVEIIDGDTVVLERDGGRSTVELAGIDAPEIGQSFAEEASRFLTEQLLGKEVEVREHPRDASIVRLRVGEFDVSRELLAQGLAWHDESVPDERLVIAMITARGGSKGLWSEADPVRPELWRQENIPPAPTPTPAPAGLAGLARKVELKRTGDSSIEIAGGGIGVGGDGRAAEAIIRDNPNWTDFKTNCPCDTAQGTSCAWENFVRLFADVNPGDSVTGYKESTSLKKGGEIVIPFAGTTTSGRSFSGSASWPRGGAADCMVKVRVPKINKAGGAE